MELFTTTDGKECLPLLPTLDGQNHYVDNCKPYPIHSDNPPKGEFFGEVVKRVRSRNPQTKEWQEWHIVNDTAFNQVPSDHYYWDKDKAVQPIPVKGEGKVEEEYSPICCNHKKKNGLSAYDLQSAFTSSGGSEIIREFNVWVCLKCGEIKISAKQDVGDKIAYISQEFSIYMPNAVAAIAKNCNYMNRQTDGYKPFTHALSSANMVEVEKVLIETDKIRNLLKEVNLKSREDEIFDDFDLLSDAIYQLDIIDGMIKNGRLTIKS